MTTLEEAQAVIAKHRQDELEATRADKRARFVGKFFKYRNSFVSDRPSWWLYAAVTDVNEWGHLLGWNFQKDCEEDVRIECRVGSLMMNDSGWQEITAQEFWRAANEVRVVVNERLLKPVEAR